MNSNFEDAIREPLAPRQRARTPEEREQRRIQRIIRNRITAQESREKKRKHTEFLAKQNRSLRLKVSLLEKANLLLLRNYSGMDFEVNMLLAASENLPVVDIPDFSASKKKADENNFSKPQNKTANSSIETNNANSLSMFEYPYLFGYENFIS